MLTRDTNFFVCNKNRRWSSCILWIWVVHVETWTKCILQANGECGRRKIFGCWEQLRLTKTRHDIPSMHLPILLLWVREGRGKYIRCVRPNEVNAFTLSTVILTVTPVRRYWTQWRKYSDVFSGISRRYISCRVLLNLDFSQRVLFLGEIEWTAALIESHECVHHVPMHRPKAKVRIIHWISYRLPEHLEYTTCVARDQTFF